MALPVGAVQPAVQQPECADQLQEDRAWGSAAFYGAGPSMWRVWDSETTWNAFVGFPASKRIIYSVCVVLGRTISGGLTRAAAKGPSYNCALAP